MSDKWYIVYSHSRGFGYVISDISSDPNEDTEAFMSEAIDRITDYSGFTGVIIVNWKVAH